MKKKYCPRCNKDISNNHQAHDGFMPAFWYCDECKFAVADTENSEEPMEYKL